MASAILSPIAPQPVAYPKFQRTETIALNGLKATIALIPSQESEIPEDWEQDWIYLCKGRGWAAEAGSWKEAIDLCRQGLSWEEENFWGF